MASPAFEAGDAAPDYRIYTGFWTNWSHGAVMGRTLTMSRQNADLVIAFTGVFVTFIGVRFWRILCFVSHRALSSSEPRGAFYHQRQVVLRNSPSADSAIVTFAGLCWAWHRTAKGAFGLRHLYLLFLLSVACTASFVVAGGYSSRMSNMAGSEVLLDGSSCAWLNVANHVDYNASLIWQAWQSREISEAFNYAGKCYVSPSSGGNTAAPGTSCTTFVQPQLFGERDLSATCPFASELCILGQTGNLRLDSGYLDSHRDLGLNSPENERILIRSVLQCAPLTVDGNSNDISINNNTAYKAYQFGNAIVFNGTSNYTFDNYTYIAPDLAMQYAQNVSGNWNGWANYRLATFVASTIDGTTNPWSSQFIPSPSLFRSDADLLLMFLSGQGVKFMTSTPDPWFRATTPSSMVSAGGVEGRSQVFTPDNAASPLACASQFQFCQSTPDKCGPLASFTDAVINAGPAFGVTADEIVNANMTSQIPGRFQLLANVLNNFPLQFATSGASMGSLPLLARQGLNGGFQAPISDTQWQIEMTSWWAAQLAGLQAAFVQTAAGSNVSGLEAYKMPPMAWFESDMCANQKILSTAYGSFSVFGLLFIYIIGAVLITMSFTLESCFRRWHQRHGHRPKGGRPEQPSGGTYKDVEWTLNNTMQLQRLAYENAGIGEWTRCNHDIPITVDMETKLSALDLGTRDHPRLCPARQQTFTGKATPTSHISPTRKIALADLATQRAALPLQHWAHQQPPLSLVTDRNANSASTAAVSPASTLCVPYLESLAVGDGYHEEPLPAHESTRTRRPQVLQHVPETQQEPRNLSDGRRWR